MTDRNETTAKAANVAASQARKRDAAKTGAAEAAEAAEAGLQVIDGGQVGKSPQEMQAQNAKIMAARQACHALVYNALNADAATQKIVMDDIHGALLNICDEFRLAKASEPVQISAFIDDIGATFRGELKAWRSDPANRVPRLDRLTGKQEKNSDGKLLYDDAPTPRGFQSALSWYLSCIAKAREWAPAYARKWQEAQRNLGRDVTVADFHKAFPGFLCITAKQYRGSKGGKAFRKDCTNAKAFWDDANKAANKTTPAGSDNSPSLEGQPEEVQTAHASLNQAISQCLNSRLLPAVKARLLSETAASLATSVNAAADVHANLAPIVDSDEATEHSDTSREDKAATAA